MRKHESAAVLLVCSLMAWPCSLRAEDQKSWEKTADPAISQGGTTGHDKIETVISTTGGTREDGTQVSTSGTSSQQSYVNRFLNDAATKIKEAGGGSGWAWSWEKKWKIGPDGKPHEVKETWADGNIGIQPRPAETGSPAPSTPSPAAPAVVTPQAPATGKNPDSAAAKSTTMSAPQPSQPSQPSRMVAPPAPKGVDVAPVKIAPPPILLTIFDPVSQQENSFAAAVNPSRPGRVPLVASISRPIYEDTRVKIALDLGPGINRNELNVIIRDNEGDHAFDRGAFPENYRHIFRVPNQKDYTASVIYEHPISKERQEIIHIQIPVLKMSFANRTVEDSVRRANDPDQPPSGTGSTSRSSREPATSGHGMIGWGASTGSVRNEASDGGGRATVDMSDLYTDPANPPTVAGGESSAVAGTQATANGSAQAAATAVSFPGIRNRSHIDSGILAENDAAAAERASPGRADSGGTSGGQSGSEPGSATGPGMAGGSDLPTGDAAAAAADSGGDNTHLQAQSAAATSDTQAAANLATETAATQNGVATAAVQQAAKPYLCSISIQNRSTDGAQSFDFLEDPAPTAQPISPHTPLAFTFDCAKDVQMDSVTLEIFDGRDKITTSLSKMQNNLVEHIFPNQTADAYIRVSGQTAQAPFSYKIMIPVTGL